MNSRRPISALVHPSATSRSTCVSRSESRGSSGTARNWATSRVATVGASTVSPRAAARIASASSARPRSLSRYPDAPASTARRMSPSLSYVDGEGEREDDLVAQAEELLQFQTAAQHTQAPGAGQAAVSGAVIGRPPTAR